jgi:hypothetical protein
VPVTSVKPEPMEEDAGPAPADSVAEAEAAEGGAAGTGGSQEPPRQSQGAPKALDSFTSTLGP